MPLRLPPLRERTDDVARLAERFAAPSRIAPCGIEVLRRHRWPGNVRELRNVLARARLNSNGSALRAEVFERLLPVASGDLDLKTRVRAFERELVVEALRRSDGKKSAAAKLLGIDPSNWAYHAKRLGMI